jgi:hypothetical protein
VRSSNRQELLYVAIWLLVAADVLVLIFPVVLIGAMSILSPSYFAPMVHDRLGILLLIFGALVLIGGGAAILLAIRMVRTGRPVLLIALILVGTFVLALPALWLVLLGPALVILSHSS